MSRSRQMSPRRSPCKPGQRRAPYEILQYRGGEADTDASDTEHTFQNVRPFSSGKSTSPTKSNGRPSQTFRKRDGEDCKQKIADLHASSKTIVDNYTKKLEDKCQLILDAEFLQAQGDILLRKQRNIEQFKEQLKDHIKEQQTLCEVESQLQQSKHGLDNLIKQGALEPVDQTHIIKLKTEVQTLEYKVACLRSSVATNTARMTDQEPTLGGNNPGSACCIM